LGNKGGLSLTSTTLMVRRALAYSGSGAESLAIMVNLQYKNKNLKIVDNLNTQKNLKLLNTFHNF